MDLRLLGTSLSVDKAAVLASQLPEDSRCLKATIDELVWSPEMYMLSSIEHTARAIYWAQTNATKKVKDPFPQPIDPPAKQLETKRKLDIDFDEVDRELGIVR